MSEDEDFSPPESPEDPPVDHEDHGGPEPYRFDPLAGAASDQDSEVQERTGDVSEWCSCCHCSKLSPRENICCKEVAKLTEHQEPQQNNVMHRCEQVGVAACITAHPGFQPVALNPYVLQALYETYMQLYGEMQTPDLKSSYRHLAYCNFVRWCWGYMDQNIREVIPSCVVTRIR
nr:P2X purinoceptor 7-like [Labrus bergylta]